MTSPEPILKVRRTDEFGGELLLGFEMESKYGVISLSAGGQCREIISKKMNGTSSTILYGDIIPDVANAFVKQHSDTLRDVGEELVGLILTGAPGSATTSADDMKIKALVKRFPPGPLTIRTKLPMFVFLSRPSIGDDVWYNARVINSSTADVSDKGSLPVVGVSAEVSSESLTAVVEPCAPVTRMMSHFSGRSAAPRRLNERRVENLIARATAMFSTGEI